MNNEPVILHPFFSLLLGRRVRNLTTADLPNLEILEQLIGPTRGAAGTRNACWWVAYFGCLTLVAALVASGNYAIGIVLTSLLYWSVRLIRQHGRNGQS